MMLLNHAMRLHPSHPGLHQIAARALLQAGRQEQAAIEYAAALRSTNVPDKLIAEIAAQFPPELAATAIPVDVPNFDAVMQLLPALPRANEIIRLWLVRILQLRPNDLRACDALYALAAQKRDEHAAAEASTRCADHALDAESKVPSAHAYDKVRLRRFAKLLRDVESWRGLVSYASGAGSSRRCRDRARALGRGEALPAAARCQRLARRRHARAGDDAPRADRAEAARTDPAVISA